MWESYLWQPGKKEILLIIWYKVDHSQIPNRFGVLWKPVSQFHKQLQSRGIFYQLWMEAAEADYPKCSRKKRVTTRAEGKNKKASAQNWPLGVLLQTQSSSLGRHHPFCLFFRCIDSYCSLLLVCLLSMQKKKKKGSTDTISISLPYHPCGCLRGWDTSLHCTKSMCPHVGQTLHNQLDRSPFRDSQIGESTFGSLSAAQHATYACRITCTFRGWHSGEHVEAR